MNKSTHGAMADKGAGKIDGEDGAVDFEFPVPAVKNMDISSGKSDLCECALVLVVNQESLANYNIKMVLQHSLNVSFVDLANTIEHALL